MGIGDNPKAIVSEKTKKDVYFVENSKKTKEKFNEFIKELIGRGELKIGEKIKVEVKRKTVINN